MSATWARAAKPLLSTAGAPVFSPSNQTGGVERLAAEVSAATGGPLHAGLGAISGSRRPAGPWMAVTWKTHAAAVLRHPGVGGNGVAWVHGADLTRDGEGPWVWLRNRTLACAPLLAASSPTPLELLPSDLLERVELIGPPIAALVPAPAMDRSDGRLRLVSVGRAVPRKGHDLAVEVAARLSTTTPVRLDVVGPGPDEPRLKSMAAAADSPRLSVAIHGHVRPEVRDQLLADADALLFLPRAEEGEFEGLGMVMLEAAAHGCPAVVLACGGSKFGVLDGVTGRLLPAGSKAGEIADAVQEVVADPATRQAAVRFADHFSLADWQQRVRAVAAGERVGWRWPDRA